MKRKTSIKYRILRLSLISVAVTLIVFSILLAVLITNIAGGQYQDELLSLSHAYSNNLSTVYDTIATQIEGVAEKNITTKTELQEYTHNTYFKDFSIAKPDGTTLNNTNISDRDYFQRALEGETYISAPVLRKTDNTVTAMVGTKMLNGNVLYGAIDWHSLSAGLSAETLGNNGVVIVVDEVGQVVASSDESLVQNMTNAQDDEYWLKSVIHNPGHSKLTNGSETFYTFTEEFGEHGWSITVAGNLQNTTNSIISSMLLCVIIAVVIMALEVVIAFAVANKITKPIKLAVSRLDGLSAGDVNSPVNIVPTNDETQMLLEALNNSVSNLHQYVSSIQNSCSMMADGDFSRSDSSVYSGDFKAIGNALNSVEDKMGVLVEHLKSASGDVTAGSVQIAEGATSLAEGCTRQATAIDQINASMRDINNDVANTSLQVTRAEELSIKSSEEVSNQMLAVQDMTKAMGDIQNNADRISEIVKTIEDIAFQTNILALNASIEAARAGEAGKGFAVVANEVRELAGKSAAATTTTVDLITQTLESVKVGVQTVETVAENMNAVKENTDNISTLMNSVSEASARQASAIEQVSTGIQEVSDVVQLNSATAEQTAASCEELSSQANVLNEQVAVLRT